MANPETIEGKIQAVTDSTTPDQLNILKAELTASCLAPEKLQSLRAIVEAKKTLKVETKTKLRDLLADCQPSVETIETKYSLAQVFEGTRSPAFAPENIKKISLLVDEIFKEVKLDSTQRANIHLAMTDRLLHDGEILKLTDVSTGLVNRIFTHVMNGSEESTAGEQTSISTASTDVEKVFMERMVAVSKPLLDLLKSKPQNATLLLTNPKEIAAYNGGEITSQIASLDEQSLKSYIAGLNGDVKKIDTKLFSMESVKEQGMNFLANLPPNGLMMDFFKWLLSFDFIAKLLGYKGSTEALAGVGEELRQRKSLNVLGEFGEVTYTDSDGQIKTRNGEYSQGIGKIDILKDRKDLSKINREKLIDFFIFTKGDSIDATAPAFWMNIFNKGEVLGKDEKGVEIKYTLTKPIDSKDLDDNFKGLYNKLNGLKMIKESRIAQIKPEQQSAPQTPSGVAAPAIAPVLPVAPVAPARPSPRTPEAPKDPKVLLAEAFTRAQSFPFQFGKETVSFSGKRLNIGQKQFSLEVSNGFLSPSVSSIELNGGNIVLGHLGGPTTVAKSDILPGIESLLDMNPNANREIVGEKGKLVITRVA